jgi:uncharacterized Zn finger protein
MECPNCENELKLNQELSRGMGNQSFQECSVCGTVALVSGEVITQCWPRGNGTEKGVTKNAVRTVR